MKIDTTPVESNNKVSNARLVMTSLYATMLTLTSAVMIHSSPEAVQAFTAHPVAAAAAVSLAIVGALKFINKSIDAILREEETEELAASASVIKRTSVAELSGCSSSDDIQQELDRVSKDKSASSDGPTARGPKL